VRKIVDSDKFNSLIIVIIIFNTIVLAVEHHDMPAWQSKMSEIFNFIFSFVFLIEMILKLFGLGLKDYLADNFNKFDGIIVLMSLVEMFQSSDEKNGITVLRAFRLLRIFKIIRSWTEIRVLLTTVLASLGAITNLGFLTILYLFIFALLAKQFFDKDMINEDGEVSRYSFRTTIDSLITIFIILTGENWNEIMVLTMTNFPDYKPAIAIFFMSIVVIGNYMLLNLFLAILLKFISENGGSENKEVEEPKPEEEQDAIMPPFEFESKQKDDD
jgi:hypothetical protein